MPKFRKKPVVIEAIKWDGEEDTFDVVLEWGAENEDRTFAQSEGSLYIATLEGEMRADKGDWIIRGIKGEVYPCKPDIFVETYDPA